MKLCIVGQGQLAQVTAICCEPYHERVEPKNAEVLWVCYDTPLKTGNEPDVEWMVDETKAALMTCGPSTRVLISSPLPVGTTAKLERWSPSRAFAYSPENIRVAHGVEDFMHQARIVIGLRTKWPHHPEHPIALAHKRLQERQWLVNLLSPFTKTIIWTDPETAEMAKHALNAYLAMNITFANEIGRLCEAVGADAQTVAQALLTERRVSPEAPLRPGEPYGGGHLSRDIWCLRQVASKDHLAIPLLKSIEVSNSCVTVPMTPSTARTSNVAWEGPFDKKTPTT